MRLEVYTADGKFVGEARTIGGARRLWKPGYEVSSAFSTGGGSYWTRQVEEYKGPEQRKITWDGVQYEISYRDSQMGRLYKAEREAFGEQHYRVVLGGKLEHFQQLVDGICSTQFWHDLNIRAGHKRSWPTISLRSGRGCATGGRLNGIKLPLWARTVSILLHEMAHVVAPMGSGHHWPFAACFIALVGEYMGEEHAKALRASFRRHSVRYLPSRKVQLAVAACPPPESGV